MVRPQQQGEITMTNPQKPVALNPMQALTEPAYRRRRLDHAENLTDIECLQLDLMAASELFARATIWGVESDLRLACLEIARRLVEELDLAVGEAPVTLQALSELAMNLRSPVRGWALAQVACLRKQRV